MKLSELIKNLNKFKKEFGDCECVYAVDDEGNEFKEVYYQPTPMCRRMGQFEPMQAPSRVTHVCIN